MCLDGLEVFEGKVQTPAHHVDFGSGSKVKI